MMDIEKRCREAKREIDKVYRYDLEHCRKCRRKLDPRTVKKGLVLCGKCRGVSDAYKSKGERNGLDG